MAETALATSVSVREVTHGPPAMERFHISRKQKPLQHICVVAFSDGKPDSTPSQWRLVPENALDALIG
jgi:hypothetical protein